MANLKEIRTRISSVKSTRQITSAMKMVSAAKLRRAQDAIIQLRPYADKLTEILAKVSGSVDVEEGNKYGEIRDLNRVLLVVVTSNKGLCGAFNSNVLKLTQNHIGNTYKDLLNAGKLDVITIGKKGYDFLRPRKYPVVENHSGIFEDLKFDNVLPFVNAVMEKFTSGYYDRVEIIYNQFVNAAVQELKVERFLPIEPKKSDETDNEAGANYIFEPSKAYIVDELIPKSLKTQFYKALLDSFAAEHGARMTAMHKATDNATELVKELTLTYNKARQASITNEILEIVAGAEALKSE